MANPYFQFKQFTVFHDRCAMKVTTDGCLFGAWCAEGIRNSLLRQTTADEEELGIEGNSIQKNILDIGTGSGLLSLMVAQKNKVKIDAIEIDADAAAQAMDNVRLSPWPDRIRVINENILKFNLKGSYNIIVSNPPFYERELEGPASIKNLAHHSGGLLLAQLFDVIKTNLTADGKFFVLQPFKRIDESIQLLDKANLYIHKKVMIRTSVNHQSTRVMIMGGKKEEEIIESVIDIRNENGYTPEFISLLKDYYL